jgi:hypothetical protein
LSLGALAISGCMMDVELWPRDTGNAPIVDDPVDIDGDGYTVDEGDCDDGAVEISPGLTDNNCDAVDNNCDGVADEGGCSTEAWFEQTLKADVLVVIDDTISMHDHGFVDLAVAGASYLLEPLRGAGMDTHIGVITSDMVNPTGEGRLQEAFGRRWITGTSPFDPAAAEDWLEAALLGDGEGVMHPPPTPKAAIEAAVFDQVDGHNDGFFRPDAGLSIFLIGDSDDPAAPAPNELLAALRSMKVGTGTDVTFYAITQDDTVVCDGKGPKADALLELVSQTEGAHDSVCRSEYGGFMTGVSQQIATDALGSVFVLPRPAEPWSVSVWIEDQGDVYPWVGFSMRDAWTLLFNERPPAGSQIRVNYREDPTL